MKLEDLKAKDTFYKVDKVSIKRYEYLMPYPFHNPENIKVKGYHIILDKSLDEPKRVYYTEIEKILEQQCFTYEDAKKLQIKLSEEWVQFLKEKEGK